MAGRRRLGAAGPTVLAALAATLGCRSGDEPRAAPPVPPSAPAPAADAAISATPVPRTSRQLILVRAPSWDEHRVELQRYRRDGDGDGWEAEGEAIAATIGAGGMGWGIGLHGEGAPALPGPVKAEGDGKSPAGVFAIGAAFGYAPEPPPGTAVDYVAVDQSWRCVDDPGSRLYNRVLSIDGVAADWKSAEQMRRSDDLYRRGLLIDHNRLALGRADAAPAAMAGDGSCIFFHIWAAPAIPTVGCTALDADALEEVIAWLDPSADPVLVQLPEPFYRQLRGAWGLP